jgi:hypothetical protein
MPNFTVNNGGFTPSTAADNYTLDAQAAGVVARVVMISWGGSGTTSIGYRTRWTRPTGVGSSTFTSLSPAASNPNYPTPGARAGSFATQPTLAADPASNLFATDWNVQGSLGILVHPVADPWFIVFGAATQQISCRNTKGTDAGLSSYGLEWAES